MSPKVGQMVGMVVSALEQETIGDCGHFLPEERPEAVVRHVLAMLSKTASQGQQPPATGAATMTDNPSAASALPPDDPQRHLTVARPNSDENLPHIGMVGDTYTILLGGKDTAGRYCLIDMHVPPGGGPAPHRHDFEEMFTVLDGEIEITFRGQKAVARVGETVNIPANAPHSFTNHSKQTARLLCMCTPAGQDEFFMAVGVSVARRTTPPPKPDPTEQAAFMAKAEALAPQYRTELLKP